LESVLLVHGNGQKTAPEQRVLRGVILVIGLHVRVLLAALRRVPVRVAVRGATHLPGRQVSVVRSHHRFGAVQRAAARHQEQGTENDEPELLVQIITKCDVN